MLRTFFKLTLASALTVSVSLADDFLAKASKGALSDNSLGVKKLTADEASKVVGGYKLYNNGEHYLLQNLNSGVTKLTQIGVLVEFTDFELKNSVSCGFGGDKCESNTRIPSAKSAYQQIVSQANQNRGKSFALTATKTAVATNFGMQYKFATAAAVVGVSGGKAYRIRSGSASGTIFNEVKRAYENKLNQILVTRY